jgi:hypothetical protein
VDGNGVTSLLAPIDKRYTLCTYLSKVLIMAITKRIAPWFRRAGTGTAVIISLLASFITFVAPATSAQACDTVTTICTTVPNNPGPGTTASTNPSGGSTCPSSTGNQATGTDGTIVRCGYAKFPNSKPVYMGDGIPPTQGWPSPLPTSYYGRWDNGYGTQGAPCMNSPKRGYDPLTGDPIDYYALGVSWTDKATWHVSTVVNDTVTFDLVKPKQTVTALIDPINHLFDSPHVGKSYTNTTKASVFVWVIHVTSTTRTTTYTSRSTSYSCDYPSLPFVSWPKVCPTYVGPGYMTGPSGNANTNYPQISPGVFDPRYAKHKWASKPIDNASVAKIVLDPVKHAYLAYSPIGWDYHSGTNKSQFLDWQSNTAGQNSRILSEVLNCDDLKFESRLDQSACWDSNNNYLTWKGTLTDPSNPCGFVPGNYQKTVNGYSIKCYYGVYPYEGKVKFKNCLGETSCADCSINQPVHFYCSGANPSEGAGRDDIHDFMTYGCGGPDGGGTPVCKWTGNATPTIYGPTGSTVANGSQVSANGKQWRVAFPKVSITGVSASILDNFWMQFVTADGSQPVRPGVSPGADNQQVLGSTDKTSKTSALTVMDSSTGTNNWNNQDFYMRFFQGTNANTSTAPATLTGGAKGNTVNTPKGGLLPYGVYAVYHYTYKVTSSTSVGGTVTLLQPGTCISNMAYFYPVSGRVSG